MSDPAPIRLREYVEQRVLLDLGDARFLAERFTSRITVRAALDGEGFLVQPSQHVGVLALPSGARLEIAPKVPIDNLFRMLAVALSLRDPFLPEGSAFATLDEVLEFLANHFAEQVEDLVAHGLYRAYVEREESLPTVRGRIAVAEDVRRNHVSRHLTHCRFTEFTWDIPENQIVRQVVHLLGGWVRRPETRLRLWRLDGVLGEVTPTALPGSVLDRFTYGRLNAAYQPVHALCRLFLTGSSLAEAEGMFDYRGFLLDMNVLFETFVTQTLTDRAVPPVTVEGQARDRLDEAGRVPIRPDILVRRGRVPVLVADCKYKRRDPGDPGHADLYQLLAYGTALGIDRALLVYPRHEVALDDEVRVRNSPVTIRRVSVDLTGDGAAFATACRRLAEVALAG